MSYRISAATTGSTMSRNAMAKSIHFERRERTSSSPSNPISIHMALAIVLAVLFLSNLASAAAYTASVTGNWNNAATWGGAGIPTTGDTATINAGVTVTIPAGYTANVGTSPTDDTGAVALTINGPLVINGTLVWKGPVRQGNATVTVNGGGTISYDASGAATPASALYKWQIASASSQANAKVVCSGTSGSHATINSVGNYQSGEWGIPATSWADGGRFEASYCDISYQGAATTSGTFLSSRLSTSAGRVIFDDSTIDHCGQITVNTTWSGDSTFRIQRTKITNPANSMYMIQGGVAPAALTTGQRLIANSDITGRIYILGTGGIATGFTVQRNVIRNIGLRGIDFTSGSTVAAWSENLFAFITTDTSSDPSISAPAGTLSVTYYYRGVVPAHSNTHPVYATTQGGNVLFDQWIFQYTGSDTNSDMIEPGTSEATAARTFTVQNSLFLPNRVGDAAGSYLNDTGGKTRTYTKLIFDHNTAVATGTAQNYVYGVGCEAASSNWPAGTVQSVRSNLLWRPASGAGTLFSYASSCTVADGAISASDHNATYNMTGSIYGAGYIPAAKFAVTPGTGDVSADPQFVDASRSLLNFDQGYLGQATATVWSNGSSYNVGDLVSSSDSTFYGSAIYNYRCISAHTAATATNKPGAGSTWTQYWEPAALKSISDSILTGQTFSGGTNSMIGELVAWVKAGFRPQNAALATAAHDGTTIGAVAYQAPAASGTRKRVIVVQ